MNAGGIKLDYWVTGYGERKREKWRVSRDVVYDMSKSYANEGLTLPPFVLSTRRHRFFDGRIAGTGGTFHGAGKYIKENSPDTKIILAEPGAANIVGSGIKTERNPDGSPVASHPAFAPHPIQGELLVACI